MRPFDENGAFRPLADDGQLVRLAIRGAGATVLSQSLGLAVQIIATAILARLLAPRDFGLVTMATTFSLLLVNFGGNGFTEAVIQRPQINHAQVSNLFWINVGISTLLSIAFAATGSLLAWFYHDPLMVHVAAGISLSILLSNTSVEHLALLKRAMCFSAVSVNDVVARIVSVIVSILLAVAGWGYWALIGGLIALPVSQSVGAWYLCRWLPGFPRPVAGTGSMVRFAMDVYGRFALNYFARNTDNVLVGWRFEAQSLGFYKKAYDLFALPAGLLAASLTNVAVSALSRLYEDREQYTRYLVNALGVMAFIGMGLAADLTLIGKDIIRVLLGPGWEPASKIFTFFGPGIGVMLLYYTNGWIHLSVGRADRWFRWGIIEFAVTVLLFIVSLPWGPEGMAMAWAGSFWILTLPALWYAGRPIQLRVTTLFSAVWKYVVAAALAGVACGALSHSLPFFAAGPAIGGAMIRIVAVSMVFSALYLCAVALIHRNWAPFYELIKLIVVMLPDTIHFRTPAPEGSHKEYPVAT